MDEGIFKDLIERLHNYDEIPEEYYKQSQFLDYVTKNAPEFIPRFSNDMLDEDNVMAYENYCSRNHSKIDTSHYPDKLLSSKKIAECYLYRVIYFDNLENGYDIIAHIINNNYFNKENWQSLKTDFFDSGYFKENNLVLAYDKLDDRIKEDEGIIKRVLYYSPSIYDKIIDTKKDFADNFVLQLIGHKMFKLDDDYNSGDLLNNKDFFLTLLYKEIGDLIREKKGNIQYVPSMEEYLNFDYSNYADKLSSTLRKYKNYMNCDLSTFSLPEKLLTYKFYSSNNGEYAKGSIDMVEQIYFDQELYSYLNRIGDLDGLQPFCNRYIQDNNNSFMRVSDALIRGKHM